MKEYNDFIPYIPQSYSPEEMLQRSQEYYEYMDKRRSLRMFSNREVSRSVIENIVMTASTAPSGAHKQPWSFCVVESPEVKKAIREAAEKEEFDNYNRRMSQEWLDDLKPFATNWEKPFLEIAPWLIVVFKRVFEGEGKEKKNNYYVNESIGLATGFLLTAVHHAGLVALTHTPSPMGFLCDLLERPSNERAFLLIPVGYPAENAVVPKLKRKPKDEVLQYY